jgi:short-subunit dehydrogenase
VRNQQKAQKLNDEIPANGKIILADLASDECMKTLQHAIGQTKVDLLINNAGIGGHAHLLDGVESEEILNLLNVHCLGVLRVTKALKENLLKANNPLALNMNSRLGSITRQSNGSYNNITVSYSYRIAKAAQNMLTACLRKEFNGQIKFLSIHPGKMKTAIAQVDADVEPQDIARKILAHFEGEKLYEENGITELEKELIEW